MGLRQTFCTPLGLASANLSDRLVQVITVSVDSADTVENLRYKAANTFRIITLDSLPVLAIYSSQNPFRILTALPYTSCHPPKRGENTDPSPYYVLRQAIVPAGSPQAQGTRWDPDA